MMSFFVTCSLREGRQGPHLYIQIF